ncbi:MAG: hypothetical protein FIO02_08850 [Nitrosopumilales archaeon]|jgi:hypothetical protein|nr:hypothetical protein [Nitrosopumilales archaeon]
MKVSNLVNGFPDNSGDNVLQAVSNLHFLGYISVYDSLPHYISLSKDMRKEVLQIVDPNLNKDSQTKQYSSNEKIVNSKVVENANEIKNNKTINSKPVAITRTIAFAIILIGSVIATGASLLVYTPMVNNQELGSPLIYHPAAFSHTINKFQSLNTPISAQEAGVNSFAVETTINPGGGSFIDNVFVVDDSDNTFHRIIFDVGTENVSGASTTIYLRNAFVVLNI